jgi:phosphatidylserine decarboxylase
MRSRLLVWVQFILPQRLLGRCVYHLARCTLPMVKTPLIRWFARQYAVNLDEAQRPRCEDYASFNDFFTRALRPGTRPIATGASTLVAAADGRVTEFGTARDGQALQAKGMPYALEELLGPPPGGGAEVTRGDFVTIYLAPRDYHRVHLPLAGTLTSARYVPGKRFSVNATTARAIPRLFCRNERLILWFDTPVGSMAVVLVGALNVASLATPWLGEIPSGRPLLWDQNAIAAGSLECGVEIGRFNLGSTVITALPPGSTRWNTEIAPGTYVRMGQALGSITRHTEPD